jgi:hypothetical protein
MRKETKTWQLYTMILVYCFAIIGVLGLFIKYFFNTSNELILLFAATIVTTLVAVFLSEITNNFKRINRRK